MRISKLILVFLLIKSTECKKSKPADIRFLSVSLSGNPKYLENYDMGLTPGSDGRSFDLTATLVKNITKDLYGKLKLFAKENLEDEYKEFFTYEINICKLMDGFMSKTIFRYWAQNLNKFSNIPLYCPYAKKDYYIKKMKVDRKSIPMIAINGIYKAKIQLFMMETNGQIDVLANTTVESEIHL